MFHNDRHDGVALSMALICAFTSSVLAQSPGTVDSPSKRSDSTVPEAVAAQTTRERHKNDLERDRVKRREQYFAEAERALQRTKAIREWIKDALWYYIDVPSFRNGEPANDSSGTPPWGVKRSAVGLTIV